MTVVNQHIEINGGALVKQIGLCREMATEFAAARAHIQVNLPNDAFGTLCGWLVSPLAMELGEQAQQLLDRGSYLSDRVAEGVGRAAEGFTVIEEDAATTFFRGS
ncbi:hypothetical protein [Microbacterium testaceum]|uniref:hypothetical protein n=1 Tax=Microbacterium testaceum TaxID=2033 RepID=UPI0022E06886|nr:hypothetical protein [Microbacterium testaceum]